MSIALTPVTLELLVGAKKLLYTFYFHDLSSSNLQSLASPVNLVRNFIFCNFQFNDNFKRTYVQVPVRGETVIAASAPSFYFL